MIAIVNYGSGNVRAIGNIYDKLKIQYKIVSNPWDLSGCSHVILPGVGAFDETIKILHSSGFINPLETLVFKNNIPILGICVGMQIMAEASDEGILKGLSWISGKVKKFNKESINHLPKLPHLGWNSIKICKYSKILENVNEKDGFYFIHNYYFEPSNQEDTLTSTHYGNNFASSLNRFNIFGVQFHPEKSHSNGIMLLKNFSEI